MNVSVNVNVNANVNIVAQPDGAYATCIVHTASFKLHT